MQIFRILLLFLLAATLGVACQSSSSEPAVDYGSLVAINDQGINVVVEIPAGTNHKIEYRKAEDEFVTEQQNGLDRIIRFLPYPGNYGFIPGTFMDPERGGDGDALDVLVLSEALPTGSVISALPVGALRLKDGGEIDTKIIAVPVDPARRIIDVTNFRDFLVLYDPAKRIIEEWFLSYNPTAEAELLGWEDEVFAMDAVRSWIVQ